MTIVIDESMSTYRPRKYKTRELAPLSYIRMKPKPLGTEFKVACDASTGCMLFVEIQDGKDAMRAARFVKELGVATATSVRCAIGAASEATGHTVVGDFWFGSVKVAASNLYVVFIVCHVVFML